MDLSLVVVNYNSTALVAALAESIPGACPGRAHETVVVDNCTRGFDAGAFRRAHPDLRLIANTVNRGFGFACNQGIRETTGRYVALVNPDVILKPGCLSVLADYLDAHPEVAVVGPQLLNADGSVQPSCRRIPTLFDVFAESAGLARLFPRHPRLGGYRMTYWAHDTERRVEQVMGAVFVVRRAVLDQVGAFDERFFMYFEEVDLCRRILDAGHGIAFTPAAQAVHLMGESALTDKTNALLGFFRSRRQFFVKHHGAAAGVLVALISVLDAGFRAAYWTLRSLVRPREEKARIFAGSYRRACAGLLKPSAGAGSAA